MAAGSGGGAIWDTGHTGDGAVAVEFGEYEQHADAFPTSSAASAGLPSEWGYFFRCGDGLPALPGNMCGSGSQASSLTCDEGAERVLPLWRRVAISVDPIVWGEWSMVRGETCATSDVPSFDQALRVAWQNMPIEPHVIRLQPDTGWVFASMPTIGMVDREPRQLATTILDRPVLIRALPSSMTWDWGHGQPLTTKELGEPYPNQTVTHTYLYFEGDVTVSLTTTWTGQYSLNNGATWNTAPGTATTTSAPVDLTVHNPHTHVVNCDLNNNCW